MAKRWAACKCFYKRNFYIRQLDEHLEYHSDQQFISDCKNFKNVKPDVLLDEVKLEILRRKSRFKVVEENKKNISELYTPPSIQCFSGFCDILKNQPTKILEDIYRIPVFDSSLCDKIMREIENFKSTGLEHSQPTSMRKHGVVMKEMGLETIIDKLRPDIEKLSRNLFPDLVGETGLDSYKAYTIDYDADNKDYLKDIGTHFDNSEVTLNVSLTDDHDGGELYFIRNGKMIPFEHRKGVGFLHAGEELHGAMPVLSGKRTNLIIWFRSSSVRNQLCPMCGDIPDLELMEDGGSWGDGFTIQ